MENNVNIEIMKFLEMIESEKKKDAPTPTKLRVSTRSAICKITRDIKVDKMVAVICHNIIHKPNYPILTIKYKDINISSVKKKKNNVNKKIKQNFFNQITLLIKPHESIRPQNIKLFKNSSMSMTGGKKHYDGLCAVIVLLNELKKYPSIFNTEEDRKMIGYENKRAFFLLKKIEVSIIYFCTHQRNDPSTKDFSTVGCYPSVKWSSKTTKKRHYTGTEKINTY